MEKWNLMNMLKAFLSNAVIVKSVAVTAAVATVGTTAYVTIPKLIAKYEPMNVVSETVIEEKEEAVSEAADEKVSSDFANIKEDEYENEQEKERDKIKTEISNRKPKNGVAVTMEKEAMAAVLETTESIPQEAVSQISENNSGSSDSGASDSGTSDSKKEPSAPTNKSDYKLVWQDEFNGEALNRDDWNVELHNPGWVNAEWQAYVDSEENIYIEDGKLVLKPIKTGDGQTATYTSGRVNTQNKHNFTYGKFEARAKVPTGKGYLPAFWLMAADETVYGQWPRCGEIDIMEVMGSSTDTLHGTIHYGHNSSNGHRQSQGTHVLSDGNFSDEFHTFSCEWEPGKIAWYVDGVKYYEENDWYTAMTDGSGELTYPAPFDQPFYIILNLAVGGSWVGYPDESTDFENQAYEIDYVRVYQKDSYNENVKKPEAGEIVVRNPDANGNYLLNGNFEETEDLIADVNWQFKTANGGVGSAEIIDGKNGITAIDGNSIIIETQDDGTVDYSIQLVQNDVPLLAGATYTLSFDAYAAAARNMKVSSKAPDNNYYAYLDRVVSLTPEKQNYSLDFDMTGKDDINCTVEFNMGAFDSTDTIVIDNVSLKVKKMDEEVRDSIMNPVKAVRADGNYIYNGEFQEGDRYLGYWEVSEGANAVVTSLSDGRRLKVVVGNTPVTLKQTNVPVSANTEYALSCDGTVPNNGSITVSFDGKDYTIPGATEGSWTQDLTTGAGNEKRDITFTFHAAGTYYLDNVRMEEDSLIKNGSFNAGLAGYEAFVDGAAKATYQVDSMKYDNAAAFDITQTNNQDWYIQLKQNGVELEMGQWYKLSLDAASTVERKLMFAIQRDGNKHNNDWTPYSGQPQVDLTSEMQTFTCEFQMKENTDLESVLSISMGAVGGIEVNTQHSIYLDNIKLEKIEAPVVDKPEVNANMFENGDFSEESPWEKWVAYGADGSGSTNESSYSDQQFTVNIASEGRETYGVQLKYTELLTLEQGCTYEFSFDVTPSVSRSIIAQLQNGDYSKTYGSTTAALTEGETKTVTQSFTVWDETASDYTFYVNMGKIDGADTIGKHALIFDNFQLVKTSEGEAASMRSFSMKREVISEEETTEEMETEEETGDVETEGAEADGVEANGAETEGEKTEESTSDEDVSDEEETTSAANANEDSQKEDFGKKEKNEDDVTEKKESDKAVLWESKSSEEEEGVS